MNNLTISKAIYAEYLALFPIEWHDRLKVYTAEELFYVYKICMFKPKKALMQESCTLHNKHFCQECASFKSGDITFSTVRAKLLRYLKGELNEVKQPLKPIPGTAFMKLGRKFRWSFEDEIASRPEVIEDNLPKRQQASQDALRELVSELNERRIA